MSVPTIARRGVLSAATAWALSAARPAAAAPGRYQLETDVWTGSVLLDAEGRSFVLRDLKQPITLLKLWAGWCPACASELPQLTALATTLGQKVEVVLISHPQYWAADQAMARRRHLPFKVATFAPSNPVSLVEQALLGQHGEYSVPKSLLFRNRDHAIVMTRDSGTDWGSAAMLNQVSGLMA